MNPELTEEYDEHRLIECLKRHREASAKEIMDSVIEDIDAFSNGIQYDDITMLVLKAD